VTAIVVHLVAALVPGLPIAVLVMRTVFARNAALWRQEALSARLEGALLVSRTAAHRINNALAPVGGYAELVLLATAGATDPKVRAYVERIAAGAAHAAEEVALLQRIVRLEEDHSGPVSMLNLEASTKG
jgi:signal transduction histidine kinase